MKLMMVCPTCNGLGVESVDYFVNIEESKVCGTCHGKAVVEPSAQIIEDLECAEIERELEKKYGCIEILNGILNKMDKLRKVVVVTIRDYSGVSTTITEFAARTKLEALRKAKNWMDWRGAE